MRPYAETYRNKHRIAAKKSRTHRGGALHVPAGPALRTLGHWQQDGGAHDAAAARQGGGDEAGEGREQCR